MTTLGNEKDARKIVDDAVGASLAACAQIDGPITSVYRWKGNLSSDSEYRVTFKATERVVDSLIEWLKESHPYELPQVILRHVEASDEYGEWVHACCAIPEN